MEKELVDLCSNYLEAADSIRKSELLSFVELVQQIGITYITFCRIRKDPTTCSLKTLRKIKKFVDEWKE